jgi:hypothetical protein
MRQPSRAGAPKWNQGADGMDSEIAEASPAATAQERERHALNFAFSELGLCWHWDEQTYNAQRDMGAEQDRLRAYVQMQHQHLLKVYDADFLVDAIRTTKLRYFEGGLAGAQA